MELTNCGIMYLYMVCGIFTGTTDVAWSSMEGVAVDDWSSMKGGCVAADVPSSMMGGSVAVGWTWTSVGTAGSGSI